MLWPGSRVFHVNETLLELTALDPPFERVFGKPGVRREWFGQLLQSAFVSTITDAYADFGTIGRAALEMVARRHGVELAPVHRGSVELARPGRQMHAIRRARQSGRD